MYYFSFLLQVVIGVILKKTFKFDKTKANYSYLQVGQTKQVAIQFCANVILFSQMLII